MSKTLLDYLGSEIEDVLAPLASAVDDPFWLDRLFAQLGIASDDASADPVVTALKAVLELRDQLTALAANLSPSLADIAQLLKSAGDAFGAVRALSAAGGAAADFAGLGDDLIQLLVGIHVAAKHPLLYQIAVLLTVIEPAEEVVPTAPVIAGDVVRRAPVVFPRIHLERLSPLIRDPVALLRADYVNSLTTVEDANAMADKLFPRLAAVLSELGIPNLYGIQESSRPLLGIAAPLVDHALLVYLQTRFEGATEDAGISLMLSSADRGDLGLVICPFGALTFTREVGDWSIEIDCTAAVEAFAYGRQGFTLAASAATSQVDARVSATLATPAEGSAFVFGSPTGSRLEVGGARLAVETSLSGTSQRLALSADVTSSALVIAPGDGDGFLADILPAGGVRANFALGLAWANDTGLTFRGSASLDATLPVGLAVGPVTLSSIHLGLQAQADSSVVADVSASMGASLGPVHAAVERVGLTNTVSFPSTGGNLGVANLAFGFKPPSGVGLSVDAHGVLTGGGFLQYDPVQAMYAGVMQLSLQDQLTLTAYGLIATKLPDGRRGYSLLIFITAEGFKPIPLGFGFVLQSIGGMVGVNRTFDQEVLTAGLKTDTLSTLLFPRDPVGNAPALLQALASAFPARRGSILLGLLARITWFTPTLVQMDLALILELGARTRLLLLGRVSALLPSRDNDLIRLNLDVLGVLDFDAGTLAADAVLVDSRLAHRFPITGSGALRARWPGGASGATGVVAGSAAAAALRARWPGGAAAAMGAMAGSAAAAATEATFVLAAGGLNPRFAPPAGFPSLDRVAIALCSGQNPRLICDAYFALTANTVQFGARASLYAEATGFSISGDLGFDALVTLLPPHFIIDFHASMQLKRGAHNLFKITIDGTLEGPLPLRIAAKAKFEILWFSFTVHFDFTLADGSSTAPGLTAVFLAAEVTQALADPASWSTRRAPTLAHGVALRPLPAGAGIVLDPLGQLVVQQPVAPLNTGRDITTFGGAPVAGPRRFQVTATLNGTAGTPVETAFAPARYFVMSDDDKLAAPSFETMDAGLVLGDGMVTCDAATIVPAPLDYFPITLAPLPAPGTAAASGVAPKLATPTLAPPTAATPPPRYSMPLEVLQRYQTSGAAARVPVRRVGRARFRNGAAAPAATVQPPRWRIVRVSDASPAPVDASVTTWSEYRAALATLNRGGAQWLMVPEHEIKT